uniref:Uncharacterized protein n=1 Tax=Arundo donax TaxID=35708 RepID=A0A0A9CUL3_ARUDO
MCMHSTWAHMNNYLPRQVLPNLIYDIMHLHTFLHLGKEGH